MNKINYHKDCTKECCLVAVFGPTNVLNYPPCDKRLNKKDARTLLQKLAGLEGNEMKEINKLGNTTKK